MPLALLSSQYNGRLVRVLGAAWLLFALCYSQFVESRHWHVDTDKTAGYCHVCFHLDAVDLATSHGVGLPPIVSTGVNLTLSAVEPALPAYGWLPIRAPPLSPL